MSKDKYIEEKFDELFKKWILRAFLYGAIIFLVLSFLDYIGTPENFKKFFTYRIIISSFLLISFAIGRRVREVRSLYAIGIIAVFASSITIELMILQFGGCHSPYYVGLILVAVVVMGFVPAKLSFHVVIGLMIYATYIVPLVLFDDVTDFRRFFISNSFLISIISAGFFVRYLSNRILENEYGLRYDMEIYENKLEELVDMRTAELSDALIQVKEARDEWEDSFNTINEAITIHDKDFNIIKANKAAETLLELPVLNITRQKCFESYHGTDCPPDRCPSCETLRTGIPSVTEIYEPHIKKYIEIKALPRFDNAKNIIGIVHVVKDITERKDSEEEVKRIQNLTNNILEKAPFGIYVVNREGRIEYVNPAMLEMSGGDYDQFIGANAFEHPPYKEIGLSSMIRDAFKGKPFHLGPIPYESFFAKKKTVRNFFGIPLPENNKVLVFVEDVTELKKVEEERQVYQVQLLQAQKMESVGRLAGGIAHDFNNLLSAIIGFSELASMKLPEDHVARDDLKIIHDSGEKGSVLTNQLLAFSRKQVLEMTVLDMNKIVEKMSAMLSRMIGEDIQMILKIDEPVRYVLGDAAQIEQVLMNLAVNARDAMPGGGQLLIETADAELDDQFVKSHKGAQAGSYVRLTIADNGEGMDKEVLDGIFEPFFTTKETGKGTGLGLAMVYGTVKQHKGYIVADSSPGKGAVFEIYLPVTEKEIDARDQERLVPLVQGYETILVVDDEPYLRKLLTKVLEPLGYNILEASSGKEALKVRDSFKGHIDLLLTDVVMPGMSGRELAEALKKDRPGMQLIFISGYVEEKEKLQDMLSSGAVFIQKPVDAGAIMKKVREVLDSTKEDRTLSVRNEEAGPIRILIVDDDRDIRIFISTYLNSLNCEADQAENGKKALEKLKTERYDLVIMDMNMPEMSGYDTVEKLREWEREHGRGPIPVIAFTGDASREAIDKCIDSGCTTYMSKPLRGDVLVKAIELIIPGSIKKKLSGDQSDKIKVHVNEELIDIIPGYLQNRHKDIEALHNALKEDDYETIRGLGHDMKGSGGGYGFKDITDIGRHLEEASIIKDNVSVKKLINKLEQYLKNVELEIER